MMEEKREWWENLVLVLLGCLGAIAAMYMAFYV